MIYCHKCKAQNISNASLCSKCGTSLLPGVTVAERIGSLIAAIVLGAIFGGLIYAFVFYLRPSLFVSWFGWGIGTSVAVFIIVGLVLLVGALISLLVGIGNAIKKTPAYERYLNRAKRHIELDPNQSIEDYSMALKLLPAKSAQIRIEILNERASVFNKLDMANEAKQDWQESLCEVDKLLDSSTKSNKGTLLLKRADIYLKLGMKDESVLDRLNYTYTEEQLLPPESTVAIDAKEGFKKGIADAKRQELVKLRTELMSDGRFKAVGYCPKCKELVNLDIYFKCPVSKRHPDPTDVHFIMKQEEIISPNYGVQVKDLKTPSEVSSSASVDEISDARKQLSGIKAWSWFVIVFSGLFFIVLTIVDIVQNLPEMPQVSPTIGLSFAAAVWLALFIVPLIGIVKRKSFAVPLTRYMLIISMFLFPIGTIIGAVLWKRINHPSVKKYLNYNRWNKNISI